MVTQDQKITDLEKESERLEEKIEHLGSEIATITEKIKDLEKPDEKPELVRLPNPRDPEEGSKEFRVLCFQNQVYDVSLPTLLAPIEKVVKPNKSLLVDPKKAHLYNWKKLEPILKSLANKHPQFTYTFHPSQKWHHQRPLHPETKNRRAYRSP